MTNTELQAKFKQLTDSVNHFKLEKAKAEANLENLAKQRDQALEKIKTLANVKTVEEAELKLQKLKEKLNVLSSEAEALLNG